MVEIPALQRMPRLVSIKSASAATCTIHFRIPSTKFDYIQTVSAKKCNLFFLIGHFWHSSLAWVFEDLTTLFHAEPGDVSLIVCTFIISIFALFSLFPHDFYGRQHCRFHGSCFCSPDSIKTLSTRCVSQQLYSFLYFSCPSYRHYQKEIWHSKYSE